MEAIEPVNYTDLSKEVFSWAPPVQEPVKNLTSEELVDILKNDDKSSV